MAKYYCDRCKKKMQQNEPCHLFLGRFALLCDKCEEEVEKLYKYDGQEICEECLLSKFEVIE